MAEGEDKLLNGVKSLLRSVLMGAKEGVPAAVLQREYKGLVGEYVPFMKLGFSRLEDFIITVPDVVYVKRSGSEYMFHAVADKATAHIQALVAKQRSKRKLKRPVRWPAGGGGGARFLPRPRFNATPRPRTPLLSTPVQRIPNWGAQPPVPQQRPLLPPPQPLLPPPQPEVRGRISPKMMLEHRGMPHPQPEVRGRISPKMMVEQRGMPVMTVVVGNSDSGTRTVKVGKERFGPLLNKAMRSAVSDRSNDRQSAKRFELPPRFKKLQGEPPPQKAAPAPAQRKQPGPSKPEVVFAEIKDGNVFLQTLSNYCRQNNLPLQFDTIPAKMGGYVSSSALQNETYGSEDVYRTATEAESAVAKIVVMRLNLLEEGKGNKPPPSLSDDRLDLIKGRVKEIIANKRHGLWGTIIPHEYKEKFKEDPPPDLMTLIKQWPDIARVELVPNIDRDIVYPVDEDANNPKTRDELKKEMLTPVPAQSVPKSPTSPGGQSKRSPSVKDLNDLYEETVQRQTEFKLKALVIPKVDLLTEVQQVVFMTYIHNPGYFCVQLESSSIDTVSEKLQEHCAARSAPNFKDLQKGQFCAGIYSADHQWTRAEILQVKEPQEVLELLFIDYGNVEAVDAQSVRWLSPELAEIPVQAVNCSLYGVEPIEEEVEWCMKATKLFAAAVQDEALIAVPQLVYDDLVDLVLYLQSDPSVSLNQKLAELGVVKRTVTEEEVEGQGQTDTQEESQDPDPIVLPEEKLWAVYITYISVSTNSVMLQLVGDDYSDRLDQFKSQLHVAFTACSADDAPVVVGANYITCDDGLYHRVRALSQDGDKVNCYFLDYGDTEQLPRGQLRPLAVDLNKSMPYQAVEVCLCGLEDVATNLTALKRLCDLALGKTCVSEAVERDIVPSVVLFDTSSADDLNINEAILRAVEEDSGGVVSPRTESPLTRSSPSTPQRDLSPTPNTTPRRAMSPSVSTYSLTEKDSSSSNTSPRVPFNSDSMETIVYRSPRLDSELDDEIPQPAESETPKSNIVPYMYMPPTPESPTSPDSPVTLTKPYIPPPPDPTEDAILISNIKLLNLDKLEDESLLTETSVIRTRSDETHSLADSINVISPYTSSWTQPSSTETLSEHSASSTILVNDSIRPDEDQMLDITTKDIQFDALSLSNEIASINHVTEDVTNENDTSDSKDLLQPGHLIWNPTEYAKRPLPPNFPVPGEGDFIDVHVNFTNDPSNFICIPYEMVNELERLLFDMIAYFEQIPPPVKKEDLVEGQLYAGHKDGIWYRAKICKFVGTDLVSVLLVDIGEYSVLMISQVQPLPWTFWKLPLLAFTAKLGSIQPVSGSWSEAAKYKFIDLALDKDLIGLIQDMDHKSDVVSLRLIDTSGTADICVDEILVLKKFATFIDS